MRTWDFTLVLSGIDADEDAGFDALWAACADEPLIGTYDGVSEALFSRQAASVEDAVLSAIADVERIGGVQAVGLRDESFWTIADIAERSGRMPAEIHRLIGPDSIEESAPSFPGQISGASDPDPLWRAQDVIDWFRDQLGETLSNPAAEVLTALNDTLQARTSCGKLNQAQQQRIVALLNR